MMAALATVVLTPGVCAPVGAGFHAEADRTRPRARVN